MTYPRTPVLINEGPISLVAPQSARDLISAFGPSLVALYTCIMVGDINP